MRKILLVSALVALSVASPPVAVAQAPDSVHNLLNPVARQPDSLVMTLRAAPSHAASIDSIRLSAEKEDFAKKLIAFPLIAFAFAGTVKTITSNKDSVFPLGQTDRTQLNKVIADLYYLFNTRPAWQVAAAAVAPPVCAMGTTKSKVKTTATTEMMLAGILKSLTGTDDLWTLTGGNLAIGSVRRYLLLWDGTSATTVVSVLASDDKVIANYASAAAALAACRFPSLPPLGTGIVGILSITNVTNAFIPGTTLLDAAGVTRAFIDGPDDSVLQSAQVLN